MDTITITNHTMELSDCKDSWFFDETYKCWCLEDILYTEKAETPKFQRLSIFVPEPYMKEKGELDLEGRMNGYTAKTVPVIFGNNSSGYMQMPHVWLGGPRCSAEQYLKHGFVYVSCGNRGSESRNEKGEWCGKSPANLVDLKTAIRFLRHNAKAIPGNLERIISVGWSAGGAMSSLLAVTGNNKNFDSYLEENGAFMDEKDDVYAAQMYCPIIDLEHADLAYEWMFRADKENENSPAGPAGVMTPFQKALSARLSGKFISYFNGLKLENPETHEVLSVHEDGRSGSGYDYLMDQINKSASTFLRKLEQGEIEECCSAEDYLKRKEKTAWLTWDGTEAKVSDLDTYVLNHRRRMKPCTSFDTLEMNSGENRLFGSKEKHYLHFNRDIADAIADLKEAFPEEYEKYYASYAECADDKEQEKRIYLINPLNYIGTEEKSDMASHYRIRVGASDADTSFMVSMILALKLKAAGKPVDYALVWDKPHCEADYPGEICRWIDEICKKKEKQQAL